VAHVGHMPCCAPGCKAQAAVSHSISGVRNVKCPVCGFSAFGPKGSKAAKLIDNATVRADVDDDAAPPAPAASPPPPAVKKAGTILGGA
jgi:hypothetical protein